MYYKNVYKYNVYVNYIIYTDVQTGSRSALETLLRAGAGKECADKDGLRG